MSYLSIIPISEEWLTTFVVAIIAAIGAVWIKAKSLGRSEGEQSRDVNINGQPISIAAVSPNATRGELADLKKDLDFRLTKLESSLSEERAVARVALGKIHARLDSSSLATAEMKGEVGEISTNVSRLLDLALGRKPRI